MVSEIDLDWNINFCFFYATFISLLWLPVTALRGLGAHGLVAPLPMSPDRGPRAELIKKIQPQTLAQYRKMTTMRNNQQRIKNRAAKAWDLVV